MKHLFATLEKSCVSLPVVFDVYVWLYRSVVANEIDLGDVGPTDGVLNVGCGALPFTAALLAREAGVSVYALDQDESVQSRARHHLARAAVADRVEVVAGEGTAVDATTTIPLAEVDVAVVAAQAEPKAEIVTTLRELEDGPDRIVVRQPRSPFESEYGRLPDAFDPDGTTSQPTVTFGRSLLFEA
ncbi:hypothetical protein [Natronobacterium gregoryi]|uniref:Methyltransferase domain-containing protein n=1 Tax=Natronobacterium gregoryi (strain ATCC 43098 / DSM 3393 / CCM 3738 / CIP 104747 / IAM 13177 / JCM 8860 / NBRC 102187 / NCIMB 2189 / SP2) TaxID=797304 RepID=L9YBA7_NATGS|nr:hypothetical protein [Natronobacterium gregoryi]ELY71359.1 hypothetical protein C490_05492 [Natronobacterium gregoryi SP2]PLK21594.1 hypothetical protein CYV19_03260 [Natronobacterium gregoryi SP2]